MKKHAYSESNLNEFVMGELSLDAQEEIRAHVKGCSECAESIVSIKETLGIFSSPNFDMPPKSYFASLAPRIREREEKRKKRVSFSFLFNYRWASAFVLALVVIGSTILLNDLNREESSSSVQDEPDYYYGLLPSETYTVSSLSASINSDDWGILSGVIDEEFGDYMDIFQLDDEYNQIDRLNESEWQHFYETFVKQEIL